MRNRKCTKPKLLLSFFLAVLVAVSILPMSWLQASAATEKHPNAVTVTVTDENAVTVTVNGQPVSLDENGSFTLEPGENQLIVSAVDEAGNMTTVNVIVNNGHTFSEGSCVICGASDPDYVPEY